MSVALLLNGSVMLAALIDLKPRFRCRYRGNNLNMSWRSIERPRFELIVRS